MDTELNQIDHTLKHINNSLTMINVVLWSYIFIYIFHRVFDPFDNAIIKKITNLIKDISTHLQKISVSLDTSNNVMSPTEQV